MTNHDRSSPEQIPELDPQLQSAVWSVITEPIDSAAVARVKERAHGLAPDLATGKSSVSLSNPRLFTVSRMMRALAACLVTTVGISLWMSSSTSAFAQVLEQIRKSEALTYTKLIYTEDKGEPIETRVMVAKDGRQRQEVAGTVTIMDAYSRIQLTLLETTKTAIVPAERAEGAGQKAGFVAWLERMRSDGTDPVEQLGTKTLEGRKVTGFVSKQGRSKYSIWVDADSNELVQIENEFPVKGSRITRIVMKNFQFSESLDESLLSTEVPAGYKTMSTPATAVPVKKPSLETLVKALRGFTDASGGRFPKSIADWGEWSMMFAVDGNLSEEERKVMGYLGATLPFLMTMSKDEYDYVGQGKTTSDRERSIVFWHRDKDGKLQAVFNDLSVAQVTQADLPK